MKKLASILTLIFLTIAINAQSLIPVKYGIKAGLNFSNLNITPAIDGVQPTDNSSQMGIAAGFIVHIPLSDKWFINPEVLYSQKGASFNYAFTHDYEIDQRDEYKTTNPLTLSYVELNPTISYKATDKLALNFGPSVSFLIGEKYDYTQDPVRDITNTTNILTEGLVETESLDVGLNLGISYFFTEHFFVDSRVYTGFIEVASAIQPYEVITSIIPNPAYTLKNRAIVLSLSYLF
ncbi:PorT family protein [Flavobacteriales bacterium]|nr:PorT family protein [Flavobacteriales bacterium]